MTKKIFVDLETTGLSPKDCAITEIAAFVETPTAKDLFTCKVYPYDGASITMKALEVQGITRQELFEDEERVSDEQAHTDFTGFMKQFINVYDQADKFHLIGYNVNSFDMPFLREFFKRNRDRYFNSYFFFPPLDVMFLAAQHLVKTRPSMTNFKLGTVAETMRIDHNAENLHSAFVDISLTKAIYEKITAEER